MSVTKVQIAAGSMKNQCPSCGEVFTCLSSFDAHRTGKYNSESDPRRCKTKKEMSDSEMTQNSENSWRTSDAYKLGNLWT